MFLKLGEAVAVSAAPLAATPVLLSQADEQITLYFQKFARDLKQIAPKAQDFLYFTAVMMHAAEACLLDEKGQLRKDAKGESLSGHWDTSRGWKWVCSDPNLQPYKNANNDIFPEQELLKAYKKWVGKPLCLDHQSQTVDMVRGIVVDTHYDPRGKRVIALCALDKKNYPDLARKVQTRYATSVSMGTGVGTAICTDCGRAATCESELCGHMKNKSCYGEINTDLSPIELSIVVNGADPNAHIKHVVAKDLSQSNSDSAWSEGIERYIADKMGGEDDPYADVKKGVESLQERVRSLADENDTQGPTSSTVQMAEAEADHPNFPRFFPPEPFPTYAATELDEVRDKMADLNQTLQKLTAQKDPTMAQKKAYYQGTEEPTPGRMQYPNKTNYQYIRDHEDKQMVGRPPFPQVGPVDGLYNGEKEVALKRHLQRLAMLKERRMRRAAALEAAKEGARKEGYFQGGGGPNEPKPMGDEGLRYPNKTNYQYIRDHEDRQMTGEPPFPQVGPVDGLYPGPASYEGAQSELDRKKMLGRANTKLVAKFTKAADGQGQLDKQNSRWDVYTQGEDSRQRLVLSATVNEIARGNSAVMYDGIATEAFGHNLISQIKTEGFEVAAGLIKGAQAAPPAATQAAPATPPDAVAPPVAPAGPAAPPAGMGPPDAGMEFEEEEILEPPPGAGAPGDNLGEICDDLTDVLEQAQDMVSDLKEGVDAMKGEEPALADVEPAPEEEMEALVAEGPAAPAPAPMATVQAMRKTLNINLRKTMSEKVNELESLGSELNLAHNLYRERVPRMAAPQQQVWADLTKEVLTSTAESLLDSEKLMKAFVQYAKGTESLMKRARREFIRRKEAASLRRVAAKTAGVTEEEEEGETADGTKEARARRMRRIALARRRYEQRQVLAKKKGKGKKKKGLPPWLKKDDDDDDENEANITVGPGDKIVTKADFNLNTKEGRAAYRTHLAKKAQTGVDWMPMLQEAHPDGPANLDFDVPVSGDLGKVETLQANHDAMMDVVEQKPSAKYANQAREIHRLVTEGKIATAEVDGLVGYGVDQEAVEYYKKYWGEAGDQSASEFAQQLVSDYGTQKAAQDLSAKEARIKRAYDLAYQMRDQKLIGGAQVSEQVNQILKWNDEGFESVKGLVAQNSLAKTAMPQVGISNPQDIVLLPGNPENAEAADLKTSLAALFDEPRVGLKV